MKEISLRFRKVAVTSFAILIFLSLTFNTLKTNNEEWEIKVERVSEVPLFGSRDHQSIIQSGHKIFMYGGFFRGPSVYQELLSSDDDGINWIRELGDSNPKLNDLKKPPLQIDLGLPSGYARFLNWNSELYLVDHDLWKLSPQGVTKVVKNFLPDVFSASEIKIFYTKTGVVIIDLAIGKLWKLDNELKVIFSKELIIEGKKLKTRGAKVFENHGYYYIYGGESLDKDQKGSLKVNPLHLRSVDGINWVQIKDSSRQQAESTFLNLIWSCEVNDSQGRTWIIGGYNLSNQENSRDIWVTKDGIKFSKAKKIEGDEMFLPRHAAACLYVESRNSILIVGGKGGTEFQNSTAWTLNEINYLKLQQSH